MCLFVCVCIFVSITNKNSDKENFINLWFKKIIVVFVVVVVMRLHKSFK